MTNDAEKRWNDPPAFRAAVRYAVVVIAAAAVVFAVFALWARDSVVVAALVPAVLFAGGVGALAVTYRVWRRGGTWPAWQGAGWFLLLLMLVCLAVPGAAALNSS